MVARAGLKGLRSPDDLTRGGGWPRGRVVQRRGARGVSATTLCDTYTSRASPTDEASSQPFSRPALHMASGLLIRRSRVVRFGAK